jgi:hypothetical protein
VHLSKTNITLALTFGIVAATLAFSERSYAVPSFARQTGMACQACHTVFPELTPFGRSFKLNGYQIDNLPQVAGITSSKSYELLLNQLPPLSMMFQVSYTSTSKALPDSGGSGADAQNGQVLFPQQASLFYAGRIAQGLGAFIQMTYASDSGSFGWDNTDIRYARQVPLADDALTLGVTLNNNPTVQDVWNSTPAWQTPFDQRTSAAPTPGAAAMIDGGLADRGVAGASVYAWWKNSIYAEFGLYRSSPQGVGGSAGAGPLDSSVPGGVLTSNAPYWRLAYERQWDRNALSFGTYGVVAKISPEGQPAGPPSDRFRDVALDGQYQYLGDEHIFSVQSTYIKEDQTLDASSALSGTNPTDNLKTFRLAGTYFYQRTYGGSLGYFSTTGSSDATLYAADPVFGFANGSPDSKGWVAEVDYVPWENVKLLAQYTAYSKFNGASSNYDGSGRNASDNNTMYLLAWLAY